MGFSGSKSLSGLKRQLADLLRIYTGSFEGKDDKSFLHQVSDEISKNAESLKGYYGQASDRAEAVADKLVSLDKKDGVRGLANLSTGGIQAIANAGTRNAANKMAIALASGGMPALKTVLTSDKISLIRGMWARIPYNFFAIPSSMKVAEFVAGGKSAHEMTNFEKIRSVISGASTEFLLGSAVDMMSLLNELSAIKISHNFKKNPDKLRLLDDETLKKIIKSFKTEKGAYEFFEKNKDILLKKIPEFDKISKKELFEKMNSRDLKIFMIENDLRSPTFTKPSVIKAVKFSVPEFEPKAKDYARAIASSSPFHILRNSSFLFPFYFAAKKDGGLTFENLATAFASGAITSIPHNIGNVAIAESMRGESVLGAVKSGVKQTVESAAKRPQVIAVAAIIRGIANICGATFYNKATSDKISDAINDSLLKALEVDYELSQEEQELVDELVFEKASELESTADRFLHHYENFALIENGGEFLEDFERGLREDEAESARGSLVDFADKYAKHIDENWIFDEQISLKKFSSKSEFDSEMKRSGLKLEDFAVSAPDATVEKPDVTKFSKEEEIKREGRS